MKKVQLFCIPYAGGTSITYISWKKFLDERIDIIPIELAGRGTRSDDKFYDTFEEAVEDIFEHIKKNTDGSPYAIFGHSMGSALVYEVAYRINEDGMQYPIHLFFSGRHAPHDEDNMESFSACPTNILKEKVFKFGGMPVELLEDHIFNFFAPILKADFKILEMYQYKKKDSLLNCDISIFSGKHEKVVKNHNLLEWKKHTNMKCSIYKFNGGHFFINDDIKNVLNLINDTLIFYID